MVVGPLSKKLKERLGEEVWDARQGSKVYLLIEYEVGEVAFQPVLLEEEDTGDNLRVQELRATGFKRMSEAGAKKQMDADRDRRRVKLEEVAGIQHINGTVPAVDDIGPEEAFKDAHRAGAHEGGIVEGCPYCEDERAAEMAEAGV